MPKFSLALIAKDESKTIPKLAKSIKSFLDAGGDSIIVDTGSTDGTPELARNLGFRVVEVGDRFTNVVTEKQAQEANGIIVLEGEEPVIRAGQRVFDFGEAMNFAASLAKNDWIIMPDADIWLTMDMDALEKEMTPDRSVLRHLLKMGNLEYYHTRVYDRSKMRWDGMSHEGLFGDGNSFTLKPETLTMNHEQLLDKDRASRIGSLVLDWHLHQDSYRKTYYLGRELYWRNRPKSAIAMLDRAILMNKRFPAEKAQALIFRGDAEKALGMDDKAVKSWLEAFEACPQRRIAFLKLAQHYTGKDWHKVLAYASAALTISNANLYVEDVNEYGYLPHYYAYPAAWQTGDRKKAREHYAKAKELNPTDPKIISDARWFDEPKVSVVIPHLPLPERELKLQKLLESLKKSEYQNIETIVEYDSWEDRQGALKTFKKGVERSTGELVMFLGNDVEIMPDTITKAVDALRQFSDMNGLVALNDGQSMGAKAEHWLGSKRLLPLIGGEFFSTAYHHNFADIELTERCRLLGRYAFCKEAVIVHDHPMWKGTPSDRCYEAAYDKARWKEDEETYAKRKAIWSLPYTGERVVPDKMSVEPQTLAEHLARYKMALKYIHGKVLDAPCGTGYGTAMLNADGCDISQEAIDYAKSRNPELHFFLADLDNPKLLGYDTVVSFEGLEHLNDPKPFIEWVRNHAETFIFSIPVNNVSKWHKHAYSVEQIKGLFDRYQSVEWFEQTGTEIKPLSEGSVPVFLIGVAKTR